MSLLSPHLVTNPFCPEQEVLREKVEGMGGSFDVNLTLATTHLLAASADTEKYIVATSMKVRRSLFTRTLESGLGLGSRDM